VFDRLAALVIFTSASGLCAIAPSVPTLIAFRLLQAVGAALLVPSSLALVLEAFPAERRSHAVALFSAVGALAAGVGPSLGGLLVSADNWRLVFLVNLPIGVAAFVLSRRALVDNLPVPAMAALGEGPIISVALRATLSSSSGSSSRTDSRLPSLGETLMRVMFLGSAEASARAGRIADLTIRPRNEGVGLLEFHQLDRAREAGRAAARAALEDAPAVLFG
jgi:MFS family permease